MAILVAAGCLSAGDETRSDTALSAAGAGEAALPQGTGEQSNGKRALVIGVGDYPQPNVNGYPRINSANDVPLVESALQSQGFAAIRIIKNAEANREGILRALDELVEASRPGDVVVVHYSGHGDQLTDDNGDELDGYDEVLVPHGAPAKAYFTKQFGAEAAARIAAYGADQRAFKHVRDDELNTYLSRLRQKVGPRGNVVFSIDSCHSGTGTRGDGGPMPRGTGEPIGEPASRTRSDTGRADEAGLFEASGAGGASDLAPYVVFSASRQGELDYETRDEDGTPVGPLALALSRVLPAIRPGESYQVLFDRLAVLMSSLAPHQIPQIEGDASTEVFSGRAVPYEPYYRVADVTPEGNAILAGGQLTGLAKGSRVAFYRIGGGPAAGDRPLAQGTVDMTAAAESRVIVDEAPTPSVDLKQTWVFVTEAAFGDLELAVHLDPALSGDERAAHVTALKPRGLARFVDDASAADLLLSREVAPGPAARAGLTVRTAADRVPIGDPITPESVTAGAVADRVTTYMQDNPRSATLRVYLDPALSSAERDAIIAELKNRKLGQPVSAASGADLVVGRDPSRRAGTVAALSVSKALDRTLIGRPIDPAPLMVDTARDRLEGYARNRYLKRISMTSSDIEVRLTIVPATHRYEDTLRGQVCGGSDLEATGRAVRLGSAERTWQLAEGDGFLLQLENVGKRPAHVAVLELYPNGEIHQMFPAQEQLAAEARIEPKQKVLVKDLCFTAAPPYGTYVYKLFATDATSRDTTPIDFRPVLSPQRNQVRGDLGPFAKLLDSTYSTTRTGRTSVAANSGSTDAILVKVVQR